MGVSPLKGFWSACRRNEACIFPDFLKNPLTNSPVFFIFLLIKFIGGVRYEVLLTESFLLTTAQFFTNYVPRCRMA